MTSLEHVLAGILIAVISTLLGFVIGMKGKVAIADCAERRASCIALIEQKLISMENKLDLILDVKKKGDKL